MLLVYEFWDFFKKKSNLILFFSFLYFIVFPLNVFPGTFISNVAPSGNWNAAGSWTLTGGADADGIPDGDDDVTILTGDIINFTANTSVNNITINGTLNMNTNTRTLTVNGNLLFAGGAGAEADITGDAASRDINVAGTLIVDPLTNANVSGIDFRITNATTINGSITFTNATGVKTFGDITIGAAGTWDNDNVNESILSNGTLTNNNAVGNFIAGTGTYNFTGAGQSFNGPIVIPNIDIDGTYTNNGNLEVTTTLAGGGSLTQGLATSYLKIGDAGTFALNTLDADDIAAAGNTVEYNGTAAQTVAVITYSNLVINNSVAGTVTATGAIIVNNDFTILNGDVVTTSDITVTGNTAVPVGTDLRMGSGAVNFGSTVTIDGTLTINSSVGASETFNNIDVNVGGTFDNANNETVTINGDITNDGTFTSGTGLYTLNDATGTLNGADLTISNVSIAGSYTNNITVAAGFSVPTSLAGAGSLIQSASSDLLIGGTITITTLDADNTTAPGNLVTYNGGGAQTVYSTTYDNLRINKATNDATLGGTVTIETQLTMSLGDLILSGNNLILDYDATVSGGAGNSYINSDLDAAGRLIKQLDGTTPLGVAMNFPFGDNSGNFSPLSITLNSITFSGAAQLSMGVQNTKDPDNTSVTDYINRFWAVTATNVATVNYDAVMTYVTADVSGTEANYEAGVKNSSNNFILISTGSVNPPGNTISFTGAEEFMGNLTGGEASAFPIEVCCFSAVLLNQNDVKISWVTRSEKNALRFVVERGMEINGAILWGAFDSISTKAPGGNSSDSIYYELRDYDLKAGVYYYRLVEVGSDLSRGLATEYVSVEVPPYNPVYVFGTNNILFDNEYEYKIYDVKGRLVMEGKGESIRLSGIKRGIYFLKYGNKTLKMTVFL
ncbi:MAG: hypothetical protein A3H98_14230 [Bacteroidetes bacterium RIFCSPLOWO2_02_FULL_36_8]|nr:MAG: hypothetical protein A3H98_14230 [Bacteroidetes bacterium RIFCSPLOWO2_02_FULL_36_8]